MLLYSSRIILNIFLKADEAEEEFLILPEERKRSSCETVLLRKNEYRAIGKSLLLNNVLYKQLQEALIYY